MNPQSSARLDVDGLSIEVERVAPHTTVHGPRGARVYVRIRPVGAEPGRDAGPRTCLTLSLTGAERFGALLQDVARTRVIAVGASK